MRVVIIGNSGGGKSVLARRLAPTLQLPCSRDRFDTMAAWLAIGARLQTMTASMLA